MVYTQYCSLRSFPSSSGRHTHAVDRAFRAAGGSGTQGIVTHLAFDAAWDDAAALPTDDFRAPFDENLLACVALLRHVPRGEWPSRGATCGA